MSVHYRTTDDIYTDSHDIQYIISRYIKYIDRVVFESPRRHRTISLVVDMILDTSVWMHLRVI